MTKIAFIGSHLSAKKGTKGISEKISELLNDRFDLALVSRVENRFLKGLDIVFSMLTNRYDVVHIDVFSGTAFMYADIVGRIARWKNEPVLMTLRGGKLAEKFEQEPERVRKVLGRADLLQTPSFFLAEFFARQGFVVQRMPNFIEIGRFPYGRDQVKPFSLLWVRAFSPEYRPELAVTILHEVRKQFPLTRLSMIGPDKGVQHQIKALVAELGLEDAVDFLGRIPNEALYTYYRSHAVYLNTTAYESFGVAVLEAASCGIPIVSTKVGEIPYMWEEDNEILMCDADAAQMAKKVVSLFRDDALAARLSENARAKANTYDWQAVRDRWIERIEYLAGEKL